jgi:hypothetical protein
MGETKNRILQILEESQARRRENKQIEIAEKATNAITQVAKAAFDGEKAGKVNQAKIAEVERKAERDGRFNFIWLFGGGFLVSLANLFGVLLNKPFWPAIIGCIVNAILLGLFIFLSAKYRI